MTAPLCGPWAQVSGCRRVCGRAPQASRHFITMAVSALSPLDMATASRKQMSSLEALSRSPQPWSDWSSALRPCLCSVFSMKTQQCGKVSPRLVSCSCSGFYPFCSQHWHLCHSALGCVSPGRDGVSRSEVTFTCMIIWIHVSRSHEGILER